MSYIYFSKFKINIIILGMLLLINIPSFSATAIDLRHLSGTTFEAFKPKILQAVASSPVNLRETSRSVDFNHTLHIRFQETYLDYPVWGTDSVIHIPKQDKTQNKNSLVNMLTAKNVTMNGTFYQGLDADLHMVPNYIFQKEQPEKVVNQAILRYQQKMGNLGVVTGKQSKLIIYLDKNRKAHWAYFVQFHVSYPHKIPSTPTFIFDALAFNIFQEWDNVQKLGNTIGGGYGGNEKTGKFNYDGLPENLPSYIIQRDDERKICYLQNNEVSVINMLNDDAVVQYPCITPDPMHNNVFWSGEQDAINGGFSPSNDALYAGSVVKKLFQKWFGISVLTEDNDKPMMLVMRIHAYDEISGENISGAAWDGKQVVIGDGDNDHYPATSLQVIAHEIGHGFVQQHAGFDRSGLDYHSQPAALNESFGDMTAKATEFFVTRHNSWQLGGEILKRKGMVIRYMDQPKLDCDGRRPGDNCSIDHMKDFDFTKEFINPYSIMGIFNRAFYLIATTPGWDTKKAYDVMVQANRYYWIASSTFTEAACGVMQATQDYKYTTGAIISAFLSVGIDTTEC